MKYLYNNIFINNPNNINNIIKDLVKKEKNWDGYKTCKNFNDSTEIVELKDNYIYARRNINIGHHFHGKFFAFYYIWRKNKKRVLYYSFGDKFFDDFFKSVIEEKYIINQKQDVLYKLNNSIIPSMNLSRDLRIFPNYLDILKEIRDISFKNNNIKAERNLTVMYDRSDLGKKNIKKIDEEWIIKKNIYHVKNLVTKYSFKETISLLSKTKKLIQPVGAGCFNLIFLDNNCLVLELNPHKNNSWGLMFGLSNMVNDFKIYISHNTKKSNFASQSDKNLDDHILFDEELKKELKNLLNK